MVVKPHVELLFSTPNPEQAVAMGAKLCYSDSDLSTLMAGISQNDQGAFIARLVGMNHLSPLEHASFTFGIEGVSRALLAQITRHRIASFSVQSQRYVNASPPHAEQADDRFERASVETDARFGYVIPKSIKALGEHYVRQFREQMRTMDAWYCGWLAMLGDTKKEDARFVLPNACATRMLVTMNARELLHFFELRCCNRAQWEIRAVAWQMLRLARDIAPTLFSSAGPSCVRGACTQGKLSCGNPYTKGSETHAPSNQ